MSIELKPCPFCGKRPDIVGVGGYFLVKCVNPNCDMVVNTYSYRYSEKAVEVWNNRKNFGAIGEVAKEEE